MVTNSRTLVKHQWAGRIFAIIVALVALVLVIQAFPGMLGGPAQASLSAENPSSTASTTSNSEECEAGFTQVSLGHGGNKVDENFEKDYVAATVANGNLPEAATGLLLKKAGQDAQFLAIRTFELGLHEDANDWKGLVDGDCLSKEGQKLHAQYEGVLKSSGTVITEEQAPSNAVNSGVHDDVYGVASSTGIYGDLRAIKITLKDGTSVYILVRCANGVFPGNPGLPEVPTDNPPPPQVCPPDMPYGEYPVCKDAPSNDPSQNGNAPIGGGPNEDTGPGEYIPPTQMEQPPTTPRVNPPPPPPVPPAPNNPTTPVPTEDPTPPPPRQPDAPTPTNPETGCDASVPGVVC